VTVARRANYGFEKRQKELKRLQKREEKAARKKEKRERDARETGAAPQNVDDPASDGTGSGGEDD
jgi:hypothetical protein